MKKSETGCYMVALSFLDFLSSRNDSFLHNIALQHINVLKSLSEKTALVGLVVCFKLAICIEAMDVLLTAGQCTVCLSQSGNTGSVSPC